MVCAAQPQPSDSQRDCPETTMLPCPCCDGMSALVEITITPGPPMDECEVREVCEAMLRRRGFTLVELLVTIAIIGMLTAMTLGGLYQARTKTQANRTRNVVKRLETAITPRWESYQTRRLPLSGAQLRAAAVSLGYSTSANVDSNRRGFDAVRLVTLREMMRLEMPHRYEDLTSDLAAWPTCPAPATQIFGQPGMPGLPAMNQAYLRRLNNNRDHDGNPVAPTDQHQNAECLHLVVTTGGIDQETTPVDMFSHEDVGDVDDDGMPEFLDSWGNPIAWLRWPAGFVSEKQPQPVGNALEWAIAHPDPFDPAGIDRPLAGATEYRGYRLEPLIYSSGPDGVFDITGWIDPAATMMTAADFNDPYFFNPMTNNLLGSFEDYDSDGRNDLDNVSNQQPPPDQN